MPLLELRELSESGVVNVVNDVAEAVDGFKIATHHPRVVEDLGGSLDRLRERTKHVEGLCHDEYLFAAQCILRVGPPRVEGVSSIRKEDTAILGLGLLEDLEELGGDLRLSRDALVLRASKDQEAVLALNNCLSFFLAVTAAG